MRDDEPEEQPRSRRRAARGPRASPPARIHLAGVSHRGRARSPSPFAAPRAQPGEGVGEARVIADSLEHGRAHVVEVGGATARRQRTPRDELAVEAGG